MTDLDNMLFPLIPLRDVVVYPHMVVPLFVGRQQSIKALERAMDGDKRVFLIAQKDAGINDPTPDDLYSMGSVATILQLLKLPDGTVKVLVEGTERGEIKTLTKEDGYYMAELVSVSEVLQDDKDLDLVVRTLLMKFDEFVKINRRIPAESVESLETIDDPARLADTIAAHVPLDVKEKQLILESHDVIDRLKHVMTFLEGAVDKTQVKKRLDKEVKKQMEKSQREYYLNEQMKAIQKELGEIDDESGLNEMEALEKKINGVGMPKDALEKAKSEFSKLKMMPPMSAEATVSRNYLDWMVALPWKKTTKLSTDLSKAQKILEVDHYGLEKVKERVIEHLAVNQRTKKQKGPILCFVGPPGVGKTSMGESIARATGREFIRMSLGGVRDEAEIRGHRRTYIGSMPGKILQKISKTKVRNPLFMLDEVDKMAMDFRGDPASALLEVLDPEQNHAFNDHYLEVDYDLSDVMFVATSNSMNIPAPLLDRMEVIRLAGYTEDEKLHIALNYLIPKQIENAGLKPTEVKVTEGSVREIIRHYTREAGVRNLDRSIAKVCRKVVKEIILKSKKTMSTITARNIEKYLGVKKFLIGLADEEDQVGQVTGLAWTEVGGEILKIESVLTPGKGKVTSTGSLGDVMQESIQAALTVVRSRAPLLGIDSQIFQKSDIHVHVPEGATPKDGPSAGVGMCVALISAITKIPVRADVAMTGEITLRGEVLPIGGLKEKLIAALRGGIKTVIIPHENARDLRDMPKNITKGLDIIPVQWIDKVLEIALTYQPTPLEENDTQIADASKKTKSRKKPKQPRAH